MPMVLNILQSWSNNGKTKSDRCLWAASLVCGPDVGMALKCHVMFIWKGGAFLSAVYPRSHGRFKEQTFRGVGEQCIIHFGTQLPLLLCTSISFLFIWTSGTSISWVAGHGLPPCHAEHWCSLVWQRYVPTYHLPHFTDRPHTSQSYTCMHVLQATDSYFTE